MDNNELLMIVLAFVVGYMARDMMKSICGQRIVEGYGTCTGSEDDWTDPFDCATFTCRKDSHCDDWMHTGDDHLKCRKKKPPHDLVPTDESVEGTCQPP